MLTKWLMRGMEVIPVLERLNEKHETAKELRMFHLN